MSTSRLIGASLLALGCACSPGGAGPAAKPRVILISIDTLRADALGAYGQTRPTSPTFDQLASESIVFAHAQSQAGVTAPSHMSLMTSLYPSVHRVANSLEEGDAKALGVDSSKVYRLRLDPKVTTLAQLFKSAGYRTAAFTGGGNVNHEVGFDQGFDEFDDSSDNGMNAIGAQYFDFSRASKWIETHKDERYFLFLHTYIPHAPYLPPAPWNTYFDPDYRGAMLSNRESLLAQGLNNRILLANSYWSRFNAKDPADVRHLGSLYLGAVRTADDALATMIETLKKNGDWDDSIVVILSDHGEEFLEHGQLEHPGELWREIVNVPLLIHLPTRAARRVDSPARLIDVLPTLCELADLPKPPQAQGVSLVPLLRGERQERPVISEMVTSWYTPADAPATPNEFMRTLRVGQWMFLVLTGNERRIEELYDVAADPGETKNLIADPTKAEVLVKLRKILADHEAHCRALAVDYSGATKTELSNKTLDDLRALGYVK